MRVGRDANNLKKFLVLIFMYCISLVQVETLPKALRTQALTCFTSSFGLIWWVGFGVLGSEACLAKFGFVKILKLKFRQNLKLEVGQYFVADVL